MTPAQITEAQAIAARHLAIRVAHDAGVSSAEIGRVMGRDHTSVILAVRKGAA